MTIAPEVIFVTRPGANGRRLVAALHDRGLNAQPLTLMAIKGLSTGHANVANYDKIIVTSAHAVAELTLDEQAKSAVTETQQWLAVGSATQQAVVNKFGFQVETPPADRENSEGLLKLPACQEVKNQRILILKGRGGRTLLFDTLRKRGAQVEALDLYERIPQALPETSRQWLNSCKNALIIVTSLEIADLVLRELQAQNDKEKRFRFLTSSQRIANRLQAEGFQTAVCRSASQESIMEWLNNEN